MDPKNRGYVIKELLYICALVQIGKLYVRKIVIIFQHVLGAQKSRLKEAILLNIHNMFS